MRSFRKFSLAPPLFALAACTTMGGADHPVAISQACSAPEFRQLDFWLGNWDVRWDATANLQAGSGRNHVTRELGGCVVEEHFEGGPAVNDLVGRSVSTYHRQIGAWRQTWVDNNGGYFALVGGSREGEFILESTRLSDAMPQVRMVFQDITEDALTWRWQRSFDGGATWNDQWVIYYTRTQ